MVNSCKCLGHGGVPQAFRGNAVFFITTCSAERHRNALCTDHLGKAIPKAARPYERTNRWQVGLLVLRPDHLHGSFPSDQAMGSAVPRWTKKKHR